MQEIPHITPASPEIADIRRRMAAVDVSSVERLYNRTPLEYYGDFDGRRLWVLREDLQTVLDRDGQPRQASFKVRGGEAAVNHHLDIAENGVVFASAGNAGVGVAAAGLRRGLKVLGGIPKDAPLSKVEVLRALNADLELFPDYDAAAIAMGRFAAEYSRLFVPAFDLDAVIRGAGTVAEHALALATQQGFVPDSLIVSGGGGGLSAGCLAELHRLQADNPQTAVVCVELAGSEIIGESLRATRPLTLPEINTFSGGTAVRQMGRITLDLLMKLRHVHPFNHAVV